MVAKRKFIAYIAAAFVAALLAAAALLFAPCRAARAADETGSVELSPVKTDNPEVTYCCLTDPLSVFADSVGLLVATRQSVITVSGESEITAKRPVPAEKVYRHNEHGDHAEYLIVLNDGALTLYCGENEPAALPYAGEILDFDVYNDTVYAVSASELIAAPLGAQSFDIGEDGEYSLPLVSDRHSRISASKVDCYGGTVFVAVASAFGNKMDLCSADIATGKLSTVIMQCDPVLAISGGDSTPSDALYVLTRNELCGYTVSPGGGLVRTCVTDGSTFTSVCAFGEYVYALDSLNAVHKLSRALDEDRTILASGSSERGFLNMPSGIAAKSSKLYVADTMNGRVAIYDDSIDYARREQSFYDPVSVTADSAGTVYVAHEFNKISIFPGGFSSPEKAADIEPDGGDGDEPAAPEQPSAPTERILTLPAQVGIIRQILVNTDKTLFVLSDSGLWRIPYGESEPVAVPGGKYRALSLSVGRDELYALADDGSVWVFDGEYKAKKYCDGNADVISIAVDLGGRVFMLTYDAVLRYDPAARSTKSFSLSSQGEKYSLGNKSGQILLCTVSNDYVSHGDVVIVDTYRHRLLKADARVSLGARFVDGSYSRPEAIAGRDPALYDKRIFRKALRDTDIYEFPMEAEPIYTVKAGRNVMVWQYYLDDAKEYSLVIVEDHETNSLVYGYVYRDALDEPLEYVRPYEGEQVRVFNPATRVYLWPSRYSPAPDGYASCPAGTTFYKLEFVGSYRDEGGYLWYRIAIPEIGEGYILAMNVSSHSYEPVFIRPAYNADVVDSPDGRGYIDAYVYDDNGKLVVLENVQIAVGTELEALESFDSSREYTKVKLLDGEKGTLTCYVKTRYLKFRGVNVVMLVAIVVIVVTAILAIIIAVRVSKAKKKRILKNDEDDEKK